MSLYHEIETHQKQNSKMKDSTKSSHYTIKYEGDYKFENRTNTECTCLENENHKIKDMCTPVKELLGIIESREGEATEEKDMSWGHDEDTMSWDAFVELRKTLIQQDVYDKNTHLNEILY